MNILFLFCNVIAPEKGGIERWAASITTEFEARGNVCFYIAAKPVWKEFADTKRQFFLPNDKDFDAKENKAFFERFLVDHKIDRVLFLWADGKCFPFANSCKKSGVPVISTIQTDPCFYENRFRGNGFLMRLKRFLRFRRQCKIYRWNAKISKATVLLSERFKTGFLKHFSNSEDAGKVVAISNPCSYPVSGSGLPAKKKELLFVGRMDAPVKQPHLLLKIWAKLENAFPQWSLCLVGGGNDLEAMKTLAGTLGLKRVSFEGFQNPENYYRDAAIFCMTSAYEGFGMVLTEAAAFGCVPVAFDSFGAVRDIIDDGENGRLVPAFDLDAYAGTLAQLMSDNTLRERLARNAQRDVERFSPEKILSRWEQLFEEILNKNKN